MKALCIYIVLGIHTHTYIEPLFIISEKNWYSNVDTLNILGILISQFLSHQIHPTENKEWMRKCYETRPNRYVHSNQLQAHLFSKLPPSFFTFCCQWIQINDLAKILHSLNHNYVNLFLKAFLWFYVFT